jgi:hypothetical protein
VSTPSSQQGQQSAGDNKPLRIPLVTNLQNRSELASEDARLVNCYAEPVSQQEVHIYKRPGLVPYTQPAGGAAIGRGVFNWNGTIYSIFNGTLYAGTTAVGNVSNSAGLYTFGSILGATPSLFLQNGSNFYYYNSTVGLQGIAPGSFGSVVPGCAYLDGTMYLMDSNCNVWGSGINNVTSWEATNLIVAQSEPCPGIVIGKQLVYVVAFKEYSTEMFYDAGNATGSPLAGVPGQKLNFGIRHSNTLAQLSGVYLWVDLIPEGGMSVKIMDQLTAQPCSTPQVERLLQYADAQGYFNGSVFSWTAKIDGHMFYCLSIIELGVTLVYDLVTKLWQQWTAPTGGCMSIVSSTFLNGATICQDASNGYLYTLSTQVATDNGVIIPSDIYTPSWDAGTYRRKVIDKMRVIGDKYRGNVLQIRVSDNDYVSWSQFRQVDMGVDDPFLANCGTFRRRAWNIHHAANVPGRIVQSLEPEVEVGDL